jgi:hypothetical protein
VHASFTPTKSADFEIAKPFAEKEIFTIWPEEGKARTSAGSGFETALHVAWLGSP